jgi:hypothetical protein
MRQQGPGKLSWKFQRLISSINRVIAN